MLVEPVVPVTGCAVEVKYSEDPEAVGALDVDDAIGEFAGEMERAGLRIKRKVAGG